MLSRVLKYDMRSLSPLLLILHIPLLFLAVAARYLGIQKLMDLQRPDVLAVTFLVGFLIYASFLSLGVQVYLAIYTYRNWFSPNGYLTMTLPVKPSTHVASKLIAGTLWILISSALIFFSLWIAIFVPDLVEMIQNEGIDFSGILAFWKPGTFGFSMVLLTIAGAVGNMGLILLVLSIGHCFSRHRILIAVVAYFLYTLLIQLISTVLGFLIAFRQTEALPYVEVSLEGILNYYNPIYLFAGIMTLITALAGYLFSCHVLKNRLNLD